MAGDDLRLRKIRGKRLYDAHARSWAPGHGTLVPVLRIDVTDKIDFDDFAHTNLQFSLQRSGVAPTKLEARKIVFQIWTPK